MTFTTFMIVSGMLLFIVDIGVFLQGQEVVVGADNEKIGPYGDEDHHIGEEAQLFLDLGIFAFGLLVSCYHSENHPCPVPELFYHHSGDMQYDPEREKIGSILVYTIKKTYIVRIVIIQITEKPLSFLYTVKQQA